jgi:L-fuconolactonase
MPGGLGEFHGKALLITHSLNVTDMVAWSRRNIATLVTEQGITAMPTIDSQVHAYERDHSRRPWVGTLPGPPEVTGDDMVAAMDAVGVDGAILVSPYSMYRFDASYAIDVHTAHPTRFALIKPVDTLDPAVAETIADWASCAGTVGIRIMMAHGASVDPDSPGVKTVLDTAAKHSMPINLLCWGLLEEIGKMAARHPNTQLVIDHVGLQQPFVPPAPDNPFDDLSKVLALAEHDNIAIKISGACTLSHAPYPFNDIWPALRQIFDSFGMERCIWGTDWTRATNLITYEQGVEPFRQTNTLSDDERAMLMGGSLSKVYGWTPG